MIFIEQMNALTLSDTCRPPAIFTNFGLGAADVFNCSNLEVSFSQNCFMSEGAIAFITAMGLLHLENDGKVELKGDGRVMHYLSRLDVLRTLNVPFHESFNRRTEKGRFVPVQLIEDAASCKRAVDNVCDLVIHQCEDSRKFLPALEWAINEITDNIHLHAAATVPGVLVAQYYSKQRKIDVAICDMGQGIKASLEPRYKLSDHGSAIEKALERGVTRDPAIGMGNGMAGTFQIMKANSGTLSIWSGDTTLTIYPEGNKHFQQHPFIPGTGIVLSLFADHPVDLKDTFIGAPAYSYLEEVADKLADGLPLKIAEECASTGNRAPALALRRKIKALLPDLAPGTIINLDFSGITFASSSFMDELFGRLISEVGPEAFQKQIRIIRAKDELLDVANVVIDQRLHMDGNEREPLNRRHP